MSYFSEMSFRSTLISLFDEISFGYVRSFLTQIVFLVVEKNIRPIKFYSCTVVAYVKHMFSLFLVDLSMTS